MSDWGRKIRGLLSLSVIGGGLGALFGAARVGLMAVFGVGAVTPDLLVATMALYGTFAALATGGVGTVLALTGARSSVQELSVWKAAALGAAVGGGAALVVLLTTYTTGVYPIATLASIALRFGVVGGVVGGGVIAAAKRADSRALEPGSDPSLLGRG